MGIDRDLPNSGSYEKQRLKGALDQKEALMNDPAKLLDSIRERAQNFADILSKNHHPDADYWEKIAEIARTIKLEEDIPKAQIKNSPN